MDVFGALPVLPLPVPVIEPAFSALLMAAVGATPLPAPGGGAAGRAAIAVSTVAMGADEEHRAAVAAHANPQPQNRFAVCRHARAQAALDNGDDFVSPWKPAWFVTSRGSPPIRSPAAANGGAPSPCRLRRHNIPLQCFQDDRTDDLRLLARMMSPLGLTFRFLRF